MPTENYKIVENGNTIHTETNTSQVYHFNSEKWLNTIVDDLPDIYAAKSHTHSIADITNLQTSLDVLNSSIDNIGETGITKLASYQYVVDATTDGQSSIDIPLSTFNNITDTIFLYRNGTFVSNARYSISQKTITLLDPVDNASTTSFHICILKNVPVGPDGSVDASILLDGSIVEGKLSTALKNKIQSLVDNYSTLNNSVTAHLSDTVRHITAEERTVWNGKVDKAGDTITGDLKLKRNIPTFYLETADGDKTFYIRYNANDDVDYGVDFVKNNEVFMQALSGKNVMFLGYDDAWFSVQDLKQSLNDVTTLVGNPISPTGENSWGTTGLQLTKDGFGIVHVQGQLVVGNRASGISIATFPVGYRPKSIQYFNLVPYDGNGGLSGAVNQTALLTDGGLYISVALSSTASYAVISGSYSTV